MVAGSALAAAALLMGCASEPQPHALNSPPADEAIDSPSPDEPKYTTDLQLSEEEKKAVDEALAVLDKYIDVTNDVFGNGGEGAEKFEDVAKDAALHIGKSEANSLRAEQRVMSGALELESIAVQEVAATPKDEAPVPYVTLHACVPASTYVFGTEGSDARTGSDTRVDTFEFVVAEYEDNWYVSEQYLWNDKCGQ
jgi:hypothetical protein